MHATIERLGTSFFHVEIINSETRELIDSATLFSFAKAVEWVRCTYPSAGIH